jgi:hypothetical protein
MASVLYHQTNVLLLCELDARDDILRTRNIY